MNHGKTASASSEARAGRTETAGRMPAVKEVRCCVMCRGRSPDTAGFFPCAHRS